MDSRCAPFVDSTSLLSNPEKLRAEMRENGYLFVRGLAPHEPLMQLRRAILEICRDAGWIDRSGDLMQGKWSGAGPFTEGEPEYQAVYKQIINHPLFLGWADHKPFVKTVEAIVDSPIIAHRLRIGRVTFPNNVAQ